MLISSRMRLALSFSFALLLVACGAKEEPKTDANANAGANAEGTPTPKLEEFKPPPQTAMDKSTVALMAKPKVPGDKITVQHVLIAFKGAQNATVTRTREEAKVLAEKVWNDAKSGINFKDLMTMHSTDSGGGEYEMSRDQMVLGFREIAWRLNVDEIGVAPWHDKDSPYGWHIIKRIK